MKQVRQLLLEPAPTIPSFVVERHWWAQRPIPASTQILEQYIVQDTEYTVVDGIGLRPRRSSGNMVG